MGVRLSVGFIALFFLSGCASMQAKSQPLTQLQTQVTDMQQRIEEQEKEIVDLKYEVKDLSGKDDAQKMVTTEESELEPVKKVSSSRSGKSSDEMIKVGVSATEVQKALKVAGLYEGVIDGKIGGKTKGAIIEFQKQHNLKADGVIGLKTWNELKQYIKE